MNYEELQKQIRDICTYFSEEGTSGYNLSEEQFQEIFALFASREKEVLEKVLGPYPDDTHQNVLDKLKKIQ